MSADFNGDGIPDLAVSDSTNSNVSILLGNGDGTFRPPIQSAVPGIVYSLTTTDLNGDGKQDLAVGCLDNQHNVNTRLAILLGNGDGTFQTPTVCTPPDSTSLYNEYFIGITDFNADGIPDLNRGAGQPTFPKRRFASPSIGRPVCR